MKKTTKYSNKRRASGPWQLANPIEHAISGACISDPRSLDHLLTCELASLDTFTRGAARLQEYADLVNLNNLTQTLAGMGIGREALPDCRKAEEALIDASARFERTQRMGLTGPGIEALRNVIEWHSLQRSSIPRSQYEEAIRLTGARIKSGCATVDLDATLKAREVAA